MRSRRFPWGITSVAVLVVLAALSVLGLGLRWHKYAQSPLPSAAAFRHPTPLSDVLEVDYEVNCPGIDNPSFADAQAANVPRSTPVIGIMVDGQAYAYSIPALSIPPDRIFTGEVPKLAGRHVVNQLWGNTAVSVTYCDLTGCARVFKRDNQASVLPLIVGGTSNGRMVLVYGRHKFLQDSKKCPLADFPFEVTFWSDWIARHPDSHIYLGS